MDQLVLAIGARVPFISVKTDDTVHAVEVLSYVAGEDVRPLATSVEGETKIPDKSQVLYTTSEQDARMWLLFKQSKKTLVLLNTKKSALNLECGTLFPPKKMLEQKLKHWLGLDNVEYLLPAFGGLTIKEAYEITLMSIKHNGTHLFDAKTVNTVRQGLVSKAKGITQVPTESEFYQCPSYLEDWMALNAKFFLDPPHPSLMPRGLLFDGPPGTGKTAGAKFIAKSFGMPLYRLDIGGMKGKYVGDSEGALNAALTQIDQAAPCVVLLDEVEKVFTAQGDKGVTSSMLGTVLWWLQEHRTQVFTIMTTNLKPAIPKELFREGRIDATMEFQGLETVEEVMDFATTVWEKLAAKVGLPPSGDLHKIMEGLQSDMSVGPVPQAKVEQRVRHMIKLALTNKKGG